MKACTKCGEVKPLSEYNRKLAGYSSQCKACMKVYQIAYRAAHREKNRLYAIADREVRREVISLQRAGYRRANKQVLNNSHKLWREANPDKVKANNIAFRAANIGRPNATPEMIRFYASERRAAKLQRTPSWSRLGIIEQIYTCCPDGYHVDHYYPLQGDTVSGLHVPDNLCYLPAQANQSKNNTHPAEVSQDILDQIRWPYANTATL